MIPTQLRWLLPILLQKPLGRGRGLRSVEQRLEEVLDLAHLVRPVLEIDGGGGSGGGGGGNSGALTLTMTRRSL